jgi:hypothetical protein
LLFLVFGSPEESVKLVDQKSTTPSSVLESKQTETS